MKGVSKLSTLLISITPSKLIDWKDACSMVKIPYGILFPAISFKNVVVYSFS